VNENRQVHFAQRFPDRIKLWRVIFQPAEVRATGAQAFRSQFVAGTADFLGRFKGYVQRSVRPEHQPVGRCRAILSHHVVDLASERDSELGFGVAMAWNGQNLSILPRRIHSREAVARVAPFGHVLFDVQGLAAGMGLAQGFLTFWCA